MQFRRSQGQALNSIAFVKGRLRVSDPFSAMNPLHKDTFEKKKGGQSPLSEYG